MNDKNKSNNDKTIDDLLDEMNTDSQTTSNVLDALKGLVAIIYMLMWIFIVIAGTPTVVTFIIDYWLGILL